MISRVLICVFTLLSTACNCMCDEPLRSVNHRVISRSGFHYALVERHSGQAPDSFLGANGECTISLYDATRGCAIVPLKCEVVSHDPDVEGRFRINLRLWDLLKTRPGDCLAAKVCMREVPQFVVVSPSGNGLAIVNMGASDSTRNGCIYAGWYSRDGMNTTTIPTPPIEAADMQVIDVGVDQCGTNIEILFSESTASLPRKYFRDFRRIPSLTAVTKSETCRGILVSAARRSGNPHSLMASLALRDHVATDVLNEVLYDTDHFDEYSAMAVAIMQLQSGKEVETCLSEQMERWISEALGSGSESDREVVSSIREALHNSPKLRLSGDSGESQSQEGK